MKHTTLGTLDVSRLGLGTMGMSAFYSGAGTDDAESTRTIRRAIDLGVTFFDTAEMYGPYINEELLGRALGGDRDSVVVATKGGTLKHLDDDSYGFDGRPANLRIALEGSLKRLGTDHVDLYYQHRMDPAVPIEETVGAMAEFIAEGKILGYGLSEAAPNASELPMPCTRSRRSRRSTPCGRVTPRQNCFRCCVSSASVSCRIRRWAAGS